MGKKFQIGANAYLEAIHKLRLQNVVKKIDDPLAYLPIQNLFEHTKNF